MTIITKPITEKKTDQLQQPLVDNKLNEAGGVGHAVDVEANKPRLLPRYTLGFKNATTLSLLMIALLVLGVGLSSGIFIYRLIARSQAHRFRGWYAIPYESNMLIDEGMQNNRRDSQVIDYNHMYKSIVQDMNRHPLPTESFKEEIEIDLEFENYETISVPNFPLGRPGRFIHDFSANKTGIVDLEGRRCFVMPLNRDVVMLPRNLFDLISKIYEGHYDVNTQVVRETMQVVLPRIKDYSSVGKYITRECGKMPTYMLEKITVPVYKRSIQEDAVFGEFAGHNIQKINIMNMAALDEYERNNPLQNIEIEE